MFTSMLLSVIMPVSQIGALSTPMTLTSCGTRLPARTRGPDDAERLGVRLGDHAVEVRPLVMKQGDGLARRSARPRRSLGSTISRLESPAASRAPAVLAGMPSMQDDTPGAGLGEVLVRKPADGVVGAADVGQFVVVGRRRRS